MGQLDTSLALRGQPPEPLNLLSQYQQMLAGRRQQQAAQDTHQEQQLRMQIQQGQLQDEQQQRAQQEQQHASAQKLAAAVGQIKDGNGQQVLAQVQQENPQIAPLLEDYLTKRAARIAADRKERAQFAAKLGYPDQWVQSLVALDDDPKALEHFQQFTQGDPAKIKQYVDAYATQGEKDTPYTLNEGDRRFNGQNQLMAEGAAKLTPHAPLPTRASLAADAAGGNTTAKSALGLMAPKPGEDQGVLSLSPEGLEAAAKMYAQTGQLPPMGMGKAAAGLRTAIINRAAAQNPDLNIAANKAGYGANAGSLTSLTKQRDAVSAFENTALKNIDLFLDAAKKVPDTGIPLLNTPTRWVSGQALGNADLSAYNTARQVAISEIAKVVSSPGLSGVLSDSARKEVENFNPSSATLKQSIAVMSLLKQDMANRAKSMDEQIASIKGRINGTPDTPVAKPGDLPVGRIMNYDDYLKARKP